MKLRILALVATSVAILSACGYEKIGYFAFDFADGEVHDLDRRKPDVFMYSGDDVPMKTTFDWNGKPLEILNLNQCCVPVVEVTSPVPLAQIVVVNGKVISDSGDAGGVGCVSFFFVNSNTVRLMFFYSPKPEPSCIHIGDEVSIKFEPDDGTAPLIVEGKLVRPGHYWDPTF